MRASWWNAARGAPQAGLVALALVAGACGDVGPFEGSRATLKEGDVVQAQGDAELVVQRSDSATPALRVQAPWQARGVLHRGLAFVDVTRQGQLAQDRTRDVEDDDAAQERRLANLVPSLVGALAINADAPAARFGPKSALHQVLADPQGRELHLYAASDLAKGPMTDYLFVRDGQVIGYQHVTWVRDHGVWRAAGSRVMMRGRDGTTASAKIRVSTSLAAAAADTAKPDWESIGARAEQVQFAALAARFALPRTAGAQVGWSSGSVNCSLYRNPLVASSSPCLAYALNRVGEPLRELFDVITLRHPEFTFGAFIALIARQGLPAAIEALEGLASSLIAGAAANWVLIAGAALLLYTAGRVVECMNSHQAAITTCTAGGGGSDGGGSGGGGGETDWYATTWSNGDCDALCDVRMRDYINQLKAQAYANRAQE